MVVSINLPQIAIIANGDEEKFWKLLDERLELCKEALICRYEQLKGTLSDVSPIHWQHGAIARLKAGETIDDYLTGGYSTLSLGYIGIYEMTYLMKGCSHTKPEGTEFALKVMKYMKDKCQTWRETKEGGADLGFSLYGTPAESLCYRFNKIDREKFGIIENVTDKDWYTNSYHIDVREEINAFDKLKFESQFQSLSTGGCISYIELPSLTKNISAIEELIKYGYENIQYFEFNTKSDSCGNCGYEGEIGTKEDGITWVCPQCGCTDKDKLTVVRRTCGYLGENFWNFGKTKEINQRVTHL